MDRLIVLAVAALAVATPALAKGQHGAKIGQTRAHALMVAQKRFARFDTNADGVTDAAEITAALQARATQSGKTVRPRLAKRTLRQNDTDGDGKITLAEFKAAAGARFDRVDTNRNGVIDAAEVAPPAAAAAAPVTPG